MSDSFQCGLHKLATYTLFETNAPTTLNSYKINKHSGDTHTHSSPYTHVKSPVTAYHSILTLAGVCAPVTTHLSSNSPVAAAKQILADGHELFRGSTSSWT